MLFPARKRIGFHTQEIINPTTNALTSRYRTFIGFHTQEIINPTTNALTSRYRTFEPDVHTQRT